MHPVRHTVSKYLTLLRKPKVLKASLTVMVAIGGMIAARLLSTLTQVLLTHRLGIENFGHYTALYAILTPIVIAASLGLDVWLVRQSSDALLVHKNIGRVFSLRLLICSILMMLAVPFVLTQNSTFTLLLAVTAALGLICDLLVTTIDSALRAQIRSIAATAIQFGAASGLLVLIYAFWYTSSPLLGAVFYRLVVMAAALLVGSWLIRNALRLRWQPRQWLETVKQARVYFLSEILANITLKADLTLIALLVGSTATALYSPALLLINTTFLVPNVSAHIVLPIIVRHRAVSPIYRFVMAVSLVGSLVYGLFWALIFFWKVGWIVDLLYGQEYVGTIPLLQIMCLIPLLKSFNFCSTTVMIAHDQQVRRTRLQAIGAFFNLFGNLLMLPFFGLIGAAIVNLLTEFILFVAYGYGAWITWNEENQR